MKSFRGSQGCGGAFAVGEQVSARKQHSATTVIIKTGRTGGVAGSPKCKSAIAKSKLSLKRCQLQSRKQISFLFLDQDFAPGRFLNLPRLADSATVGEKQQPYPAMFPQKCLVNFIPSRTIYQDVSLVFYNKIGSCTQGIPVRWESKDIFQYEPGLFGDGTLLFQGSIQKGLG